MRTVSVREEVEDYVEERFFLQKSLAQGIVNYSALARQMEPHIDGGLEAIKVALRRHREDLKSKRRYRKEVAAQVMEGTSIRLRSGVKVCKSDEPIDSVVGASTENGYTGVVSSDRQSCSDVVEDQVLISLESPERLESTPGVLAYITAVLAGRDINVTELISCREDTHIVVDREDSTKAFEILTRKLG
jgi:hypothetical protein